MQLGDAHSRWLPYPGAFNTLLSLAYFCFRNPKAKLFLTVPRCGDDHITQFWSSRCDKSPGWDFRKAFNYLLKRDRLSFCPSCPCTPSTFFKSAKLKPKTVAAVWWSGGDQQEDKGFWGKECGPVSSCQHHWLAVAALNYLPLDFLSCEKKKTLIQKVDFRLWARDLN